MSIRGEIPESHKTLIGASSQTMKETLEGIVNTYLQPYQVGRNLRELEGLMCLPKGWAELATGKIANCHLALVGTVYDTWILYQHAISHDDQTVRGMAERYIEFQRYALDRKDVWTALTSIQQHYFDPDDRRIWKKEPFSLLGNFPGKGSDRAIQLGIIDRDLTQQEQDKHFEMESFLWHLVYAQNDEAGDLIGTTGLKVIMQAALDKDAYFFTTMAACIKHTPDEDKVVPLHEIVRRAEFKKRSSKKSSVRAWCRRHWVSRCFWLMDEHSLIQTPLELSPTVIRKMVISDGGNKSNEDGLVGSEDALLTWKENRQTDWDEKKLGAITAPSWAFLTHDTPTA